MEGCCPRLACAGQATVLLAWLQLVAGWGCWAALAGDCPAA